MSIVASSPDAPDPDEWLRALAAASNLDFLPTLPAPSALTFSLFPGPLARKFSVVPVNTETDDLSPEPTLRLAISAPLNFELIDSLRFCLRREIEFVVAPPAGIRRILTRFYSPRD